MITDLAKPKSRAPEPGCSELDKTKPMIRENFDLNLLALQQGFLFILLPPFPQGEAKTLGGILGVPA